MTTPSESAADTIRTEAIVKKVCLVGDVAVGKNSLVQRFTEHRFSHEYRATIGVRVSRKTVQIVVRARLFAVSLLVWNLTGDQLFEPIRQSYLEGATGAMLVSDVTRPDTVARLQAYAEEVRLAAPGAVLAVVGNKIDLPRHVPDALLEAAARPLNAQWHATSAANGAGVERAFGQLVLAMFAKDPVP